MPYNLFLSILVAHVSYLRYCFLNSASTLSDERIGWIIVISNSQQNRIFQFLASVMGKVLGFNARLVSSLEEAEAVLHRIDLTLSEVEE